MLQPLKYRGKMSIPLTEFTQLSTRVLIYLKFLDSKLVTFKSEPRLEVTNYNNPTFII